MHISIKLASIAALLFSAAVIAQSNSPLSLEQRENLFGENHLEPGVYTFQVQNSGHCLEQNMNPGGFSAPHIQARTCDPRNSLQQFVLIPTNRRNDSYTIRPLASGAAPGSLSVCAAVAKNAVGPKQINLVQCYGTLGLFQSFNVVDMPGGDLAAFETIDDQGQYCSSRCQGDRSCKGYTWKASGLDTPRPMCHLKTTIMPPVNRGDAAMDRIRSAIMRP